MISDAGQPDSTMEQKEQERQPHVSTSTLSSSIYNYFPYFSLSLFSRREGGKEWWYIM
jgi:hypothetical protein